MMPYVHILLSDLKTWFFFQLYMFCGRGAVVSFGPPQAENFWENLWFFTQPQAKTILFFFWGGSKWCHIYTFFTQLAADDKHFVFFWVKMVPYILHTHFLHSLPQVKKFGVFGGQNGVTYTHFGGGFGGSQNGAAHTHFECFWGSKCCHIYTFGFFFGVKMLP
jgi:hypothetical protein